MLYAFIYNTFRYKHTHIYIYIYICMYIYIYIYRERDTEDAYMSECMCVLRLSILGNMGITEPHPNLWNLFWGVHCSGAGFHISFILSHANVYMIINYRGDGFIPSKSTGFTFGYALFGT